MGLSWLRSALPILINDNMTNPNQRFDQLPPFPLSSSLFFTFLLGLHLFIEIFSVTCEIIAKFNNTLQVRL